jgi:hypothetical protein
VVWGIIMKRCRSAEFVVAASCQHVIDTATKNPYLIADWTGEYEEVGPVSGADEKNISILASNQQRGRCAEWSLTATDARKGNGAVASQTKVTISVTETRRLRWRLWDFYWQIWPWSGPRVKSMRAGFGRLEWKAEAPDHVKMSTDAGNFDKGDLVTLLNVYTTQFGSYTTLLWQQGAGQSPHSTALGRPNVMVCDNFRGVTGCSQGIIRYFDPNPGCGRSRPSALPLKRSC